jgi:hypothetical protein
VACADALRNHASTLSILTKVAGHFKKAQADRIGQGASRRTEKRASDGESPHTGRRTSQEPPSWQNFKRNILGG